MRNLNGQQINLRRLGKTKLLDVLGIGADATVYKARTCKSGRYGVIKIFNQDRDPKPLNQRTQFLLDQNLGKLHPIFCAPIDIIAEEGACGHFSPFTKGCSLAEHYESQAVNYYGNLEIATALAFAIAGLHERGISYGDIHASNIILSGSSRKQRPKLIDYDNFGAPNLPTPNGYGQELYMAPEQRASFLRGEFEPPSIPSDRFALTVMIHECVLGKHPASDLGETKEELNAAMVSGRWHHDPDTRRAVSTCGLPSQILSRKLCRLFRKGLSRDPQERPTAKDWAITLDESIRNIYIHEACGNPVFIDDGNSTCPHCHLDFPTLKLHFPDKGKEYVITDAAFLLRRDLLEDPTISRNHATLQRIGPETSVQSFGQNGTYRKIPNGWQRLKDGVRVPIRAGDRLRLGKVECDVRIVGGTP